MPQLENRPSVEFSVRSPQGVGPPPVACSRRRSPMRAIESRPRRAEELTRRGRAVGRGVAVQWKRGAAGGDSIRRPMWEVDVEDQCGDELVSRLPSEMRMGQVPSTACFCRGLRSSSTAMIIRTIGPQGSRHGRGIFPSFATGVPGTRLRSESALSPAPRSRDAAIEAATAAV